MPETQNITGNPPEQREARYEPQGIEERWHARWQADSKLYAAEPVDTKRNRARCTWDMCATTPLATPLRAICG